MGAPLTVSILLHIGLLVATLFLSGSEGSSRKRIEIEEYEAGVVEPADIGGGFSFEDEAAPIDAPEDDSLDDLLSDVTPMDVSFDTATDTDADIGDGGLGFGSGDAGGVIGTGDSGIGGIGSGGFGTGMGGRLRMGTADVWDIKVNANDIVYVVDFSGSIVAVVDDLKRELKRSVGNLRAHQTFNVILFFGMGTKARLESFEQTRVSATDDFKRKFNEWIDGMTPEGQTFPLAAVKRALSQRPQAIFFFSDGRFDPDIVDKITAENERYKAQIVALLFDDAVLESGDELPPAISGQVTLLQRLADLNKGRDSEGRFKVVTSRDLYGG